MHRRNRLAGLPLPLPLPLPSGKGPTPRMPAAVFLGRLPRAAADDVEKGDHGPRQRRRRRRPDHYRSGSMLGWTILIPTGSFQPTYTNDVLAESTSAFQCLTFTSMPSVIFSGAPQHTSSFGSASHRSSPER
ncbi:hypothetical protein CSOJ01_01672 [Colletotrichum sojae]|uniref:Uncharacterized protein n=1 Tax=Colletotrichum sojae TaxID=2175907 RepID=A0A8H6N395_9PEZI|nr:hypothetical protein CSOJ01_01672 [Colletotrichum sojae]